MRYELIKNSHAGVIVDPTPVLLDIAATFCITFDLPYDGAYIALFRDERGVEYKAVISGGGVVVPKGIIGKEQRVGLTVCLVDGDKIEWAWECHPLKVGCFLHLRQTQWQLTAGLSDEDMFARLAEIERSHAATNAAFEAIKEEFEGVKETLRVLGTSIEEMAKGYEERFRELVLAAHARDMAFLAYAWAEYRSDVQLNAKGLSVEAFIDALGYDVARFSGEELDKINSFKEVL